VDVRTRREKDFAFWLYLFGVMAFWGGMSLMRSDSELSKIVYLCINLAMILVGATLSRRVFAVFGALGAAGYLGHLAYDVFKDSMMFPFVLTIIGLGVVYLGIVWQRQEETISGALRGLLPVPMRELIERRD
jgi:ABC-type molybdate transport system permease subunit